MGESTLTAHEANLLRPPPPLARAAREWPDDGCSRVPNWVYTDPEILRVSKTISSARTTARCLP